MRTSALGLLVGAGLLVAACSDGTGPVVQPQFSRQITIEELEDILSLTDGPTRVEIEAPAGPSPLIADEVEVEGADELTDEESVESPVEDVTPGINCPSGTLTLELGGIEVDFNSTTEFEGEDDEELTCAQFVAAVEAGLAAGVVVEAEREPATAPQDPGDGTFLAAELKLEEGSDHPEIEINVGEDNFFTAGTGGCPTEIGTEDVAGCLKVLGVVFAIVEGVTELEAEMPEIVDEVEFEGIVASADPGASCAVGTIRLTDGTIIHVVGETDIENESGDDDQLDDVCQVEDALDDDQIVEAEGKGVVTDDAPLTIDAIEVEFELEDPDLDFEGNIASVDPEGASCTVGTVMLTNGTVIELNAETEIENSSGGDKQLDDLCQVEAALEDNTVEADGEGMVTDTSPLTVIASKVKFEIRD